MARSNLSRKRVLRHHEEMTMDMSFFQQGCMHMLYGRYQEALLDLSVQAKRYPEHPETQANLGTCYLQLNQWNQAVYHYLKALDLVPNDVQLLYNLGVINAKLGRMQDALAYYRDVIRLEPGHFAAHNNLGVIFLNFQDKISALFHFRAALQAEPSNQAVRHTVSLLENRREMTGSPDTYVKSLFDSYADHYDDHLKQSLHYHVPEAMYAMVSRHVCLPDTGWDVLDIGCGTGLCGELFRSRANSLIGVDLSSGMLKIAHRKNIYDALIEDEAVICLQRYEAAFDVITAGDVLVYIGQLNDIMKAAARALKDGGCFAFSAEISQGGGVELSASGRFAHDKRYIEKVAACCGLQMAAYESIELRTQQQAAVTGHLYLMQKLAAPLSCLT